MLKIYLSYQILTYIITIIIIILLCVLEDKKTLEEMHLKYESSEDLWYSTPVHLKFF